MRLVAFLFLLMSTAARVEAQRARAPHDSTSARCLGVSWLSSESVCEGRFLNSLSGALVGASAGAFVGTIGGTIVPTSCIGNYEAAAVRGAIAGALGGTGFVLVTRHISRRAVAEREALLTARARAAPTPPSFWQEVKPVLRVVTVMAVGGAAIGASQGMRKPSPCSGGAGGGVATGAAVYGAGATASIAGALLVVRFLF